MLSVSIEAGIERVTVRLDGMIAGRNAELSALCHEYKLRAENAAKDGQGRNQGSGEFWTNQTGLAVDGIKGVANHDKWYARWGLKHTMIYGKWLEKMGRDPNNTNVQALLEPTVRGLAPDFLDDARGIYGD